MRLDRNGIRARGRAHTWAALLLGALLLPGTAAAQISVDELEVFLRPGGGAQGVIRVTNDTDRAVQVQVELQDWQRDSTGANQFVPFKSLSRSCGDRLKVFPLALRLEARETQPLRVTFEGADDASCWNIVFVQTNEPRTSQVQQSQITYIVRTGVKVYVQPPGALKDGEVAEVKMLAADSVKPRRIGVQFRNLGDAHVKSKGAVEIRRADNTLAARVDIDEFPLEPGNQRWVELPLPQLAAGEYVALALIDFGGSEIAAGQLQFTIR